MSDDEIELLDEYILAPDKEKFFSSSANVPDTLKNLQLLYHVNRYGLNLPKNSREALEKALKDSSGSKLHACFLYKLLLIENETDASKRASLMEQFNQKYLKKTFSVPKPSSMDQSIAWLAKTEVSALSELACDQYSFEECEKSLLAQQGRYVKDIKQQYYYRFDLQKLLVAVQRDLSDFQWVLDCLPSFTHVPSISSVLLEYETKAKKLYKSDAFTLVIPESTYQKMTLKQMEEVQQALPRVIHDKHFVASKFRKVFESELCDLHTDRDTDFSDNLEKHCQILRKMYHWVRALPQSQPYLSFAAQILRTLLELDLKRNTVDETLFREYLLNPLRFDKILCGVPNTVGGVSVGDGVDKRGQDEDEFWYDVHGFYSHRWIAERDFVTRILTILFMKGAEYSPYDAFLDRTFLQKHYYKTQLLAGKTVENVTELLEESAIIALRDERHLRFAPWNKTRFQPGESINLHLEVKNISIVSVNIFEIDTESYYRKNMTEINEYIDLTGLIPNKMLERVVTDDPMKLHIITFENLFVAKRGVYVVDFVGDGLSSRALIRVGSLTVVMQFLSKGILFHIVDEQKHICHGKSTVVIIDNRVVKPSEMLHSGVLMPFGEEPVEKMAVLLHDGFAELYSLCIPGEDVALTCGFLLNEETIKRSGPVELILLPKVTVNGNKVSVVSLKSVKVIITATSTAGINSQTTYEDVSVDRTGKVIALEYCVESKTERLTIKMTAKFFSAAKGKHIDLSCEESVGLNRFTGENLFYDLYLSPFRERDLKLCFLGKNGEPYAHKRVDVCLQSIYLNETVNQSETLQTDDNGDLVLINAIPHISSLRAEMLDAPCSVRRNIKCDMTNTDRITSVRRTCSVLENERVSFPAASHQFIASEYELVKISKKNFCCIISDHSTQIVYKDNMVDLIDLTEGMYRFTYRDYDVSILITVHAGKPWVASTQKYVEKENSIMKLSDHGPFLSYKDFRMHNGCIEFHVVSNDIKTVEVHALAFIYFPRTLPVIKESIEKLKTQEECEIYKIRENTCVYMSDKKLSDEFKYVLERKRKRNIVGSTLEKPPGLLKRHFVRETHEDDEVLQQGESYKEVSKAFGSTAYRARRNLCCVAGSSGFSNRPQAYALRRSDASDEVIPCTYMVDHLSNFLATTGWSHFGIAPDDNGQVRFEVPLNKGYTTLILILKDQKSGFVEWIPLPTGCTPDFRDVRLSESKENGVTYVQERQAYCLEKGGVVGIPDPETTDFKVVDSVAALFNLIRLINLDPAMIEWEFLKKWNTMSPRAQLEKYDRYACHELNLFVYFKDPEFFEAVVKPHLHCKSGKQFIDYFLLGDVKHLLTYLSPARLNLLNLLEKALLVNFFSGRKKSECQAIALDIAHFVESQKADPKLFERLFDTIVMGCVTSEGENVKESDLPTSSEVNNDTEGTKAEALKGHLRYLPQCVSTLCTVRNSVGSLSESLYTTDKILSAEDYEDAVDNAEGGLGARIVKYRSVGITNEYVEKQYFGGDTFDVLPNAFWVDVLNHFTAPTRVSLLTENFIYATHSLTEMLLVLALIDVPFTKGLHRSDSSTQQHKLVLASNAIIFTKSIEKKVNAKFGFDLLMTQKFCDPSDLYIFSSDGTKSLKNIEEFVAGKLYESKVVLTNASELSLPLCVVHEIPQGAIPVVNPEYTQYINLHLEPLSTHMLRFFFYFPKTGEFTCYPATANWNGYLISKASIRDTFKVFRSQTVVKKDTISDVINNGSKAEILSFMESNNHHQADRFQFQAIYWLLSDKKFYTDVIALLRRKHIFEEKVWSFSIKHGDYATFAEYLQFYLTKYDYGLAATDAIDGPFLYLSTKTMHVDRYEYMEYYPLVVSRAHEVGKFRLNIRNREFKQSYRHFLRYLAQKSPHLTPRDYIYLCTYLLCQERLEDCLSVYQMIPRDRTGDNEELHIQYDYLTAYLDQYIDYPKFQRAQDICVKYLTYPVFTWRNRFIKLFNQISEVSGNVVPLPTQGDANTDDELSRIQAEVEPYLAALLHLDDSSVKLTVRNIKEFTISFYRVDIEILFSQNPFLSMDSIDYSYVQANMVHTQRISEPIQVLATESVPIPDNLKRSNLIIRVKSDSHVINLTYFPKTLAVIMNRNHGLVRVLEEGSRKPLSGIYVKAFAKKNDDQVIFFKDGYTDLRGCFEYASVHSNKLNELKEFSLLILSTELGGRIERVGPPPSTAGIEMGATKIVSGAMQALYRKKVQDASSKYCI